MRLGAPLLLLVLASHARAELCAVRVELEGEVPVVARVGDELSRLGVERGAPAPGCRGVLARVEADGDGIAVAIRDGARRSEGRVVSDPAIAASWIDSWLHDDLDGRAWLLAAPVLLPAASKAPVITTTTMLQPRRSSVVERAQLTVGWEHVWTDDNASADGLGIGACVRVGALCVGGRGRYVREADRTVELTAMGRSDLSVLATVSFPIQVGRMSIAPEVGFGVGRMATRRIEGCTANGPSDPNTMPGCDPMDPTCVPQPQMCTDAAGKVLVGDSFSTTTLSPRFSAGVRLAVPLFEHVWLDSAFSVAASPLSHGDRFANTGEMVGPDGTVVPGQSEFSLPGEPTFGMWLFIGLRVGGP